MPSADMKEHEIRYDYSNMLEEAVGEHGVSDAEIAAVEDRFEEVFAMLSAQRGEGVLGFMDLPYDETAAGLVIKAAAALDGRFENLVVLGIGGSALGTIALKSALCHPLHNMLDSTGRGGRPRLFVLDNIDPDLISAVAGFLEPEKTLFNVVTKSGGTAETMSQLAIFHEMLQQRLGDDVQDNIIATTSADGGDLRKMADDFGWRTLPIPGNVGGRFSVLTTVGLFPAAMLGIDIRQLLSGAAFMDRRSDAKAIDANPPLAYAVLQYCLYRKGAPISVVMPYSSALYDVADWYRQIWAESLGKKHNLAGEIVNTGPTPIKALGATDQHSQIQLYAEGPADKSITFVEIGQFAKSVNIPETLTQYASTASLAGHSLNELIAAEKKGTEVALSEAGRPNGTVIMPEISEFTLGQLFYFFEMATAISGALYGIDAFDQPGVEAGKVAAYALMGVEKYDQRRRQIDAMMQKTRKIV
jgi:glucose-6-phosphate isomerase